MNGRRQAARTARVPIGYGVTPDMKTNSKNLKKRKIDMVIEKINSPKDMKGLSIDELNVLADEVREGVLNRVSMHGGHVGPNLGFTEATVALHYVFDAPKDKIVFDVSHQSYPHKMLTGRKEGFLDASRMDSISGLFVAVGKPNVRQL